MEGTEGYPKLDLPLLRKVVDWAAAEDAKPDRENCQWFQGDWATPGWQAGRECETCYCIAGWVAYQVLDAKDLRTAPNRAALISQTAQDALGLTDEESNGSYEMTGLFSASNDIDMVRRLAGNIARRRGEEL